MPNATEFLHALALVPLTLLPISNPLAGATLTVGVIYLVYRHASALMARLGEVGSLVLTRLMAFVLLCIGIQILWTGWAELNEQIR